MKTLAVLIGVSALAISSPVYAQLSGTKTIGSSGDYATFAAAVADLNANGVSGAVTFNVLNGTYTEQITINAFAGASNTNIVTFQAQSGNAADVTLTFDADGTNNFTVQIVGAAHVIFKNLTVAATDADHGRVFDITGNANHITITNCIMNGVTTTDTENAQAIIYANIPSNTFTITNVFEKSTFNNGSRGIYYVGSSETPSEEAFISNNIFNNQAGIAIVLGNQINPTVEKNQINVTTSDGSYRGIHLVDCQDGYSILKNKLKMDNGIGIWIVNADGTVNSKGVIANNFLMCTGGTTGNLIQIQESDHQNVFYNTLLNTGNNSACISVVATASNVTVQNNLIIQQFGGYTYEVSDNASILASDYNNFFTTGATLAFWDGNNYATLADLQAASGLDANSVSKSVTFANAASGDLHLTGGSLGDTDLIATPLAQITDDIDGDGRDAIFPYMGADENLQNPLPVELVSFSAEVRENEIVLRWATASETDNYGFEVQRQSAELDWNKIGFVAGHGTTTQAQVYQFTDAAVQPGSYRYRLKQIDTDGSFSFSGELLVELSQPATFALAQNYPNPFNPETFIRYQLAESGKVELAIFNVRGERVRTLIHEDKPAGYYLVRWDGKNDAGKTLSSGTYFYMLNIDGKTLFSKQMLLIK
jgi:hypothetical protein